MSAYPHVAIADFCETGSGGTPNRSNDDYYGGTIPWVKSGELREGVITDTEEKITERAIKESSAKIIPQGAILLAMYGATVGRMAFLGIDAATNQAVCNIRPDPRRAYPRYVFHSLQAQINHFLSRATGGAQPNISQSIIRETKVPLPPLDEQRRIAAILDKADALRRKRKRALELLDSLTKSVFLEMFGDPASNPKGFAQTTFGSVGQLDRGVSKHRPRNDSVLLGGPHPLIQTGEVANSGGYITSYKSTYSDAGLRQSRMWPAGTLCITIAANIAETGILMFPACFPDSVVGFTHRNASMVQYVRVWLSFLRSTLERTAPAVAQKNINLGILRNLPISLPPTELLEVFGDKLARQQALDQKLKQTAASEEALFSSLQHCAFAGELS